MRIAIVLNTSWNIFNFRMNFVNNLIRLGYEVHTIAPVDEYTKNLVEAGCIHHNVRMDSRGANPIKDAALVMELMMIYRRVKPEVILHYTIKPNVYGTIAAALLRIPVINNVCGLGTVFLKNNLVSAVAVLLYKISFRFARKVFFQNPDDLQLFIERKLVAANQADLVPGSGIDLSRFQPLPVIRNEKFTFLLISRLITDKGIMEYIEAIRLLRSKGLQFRFQILGSVDEDHKRGIKRSALESWMKEGLVEYMGTTDDVRTFIRAADCIVLPSYREGTPRTLLEAASSSKPIIATNVPGCNHVVTDRYNGLLCNLKDAEDLASKMAQMAELGPEALADFGRNGRIKMENEYDESIVINKYLAALKDYKRAS